MSYAQSANCYNICVIKCADLKSEPVAQKLIATLRYATMEKKPMQVDPVLTEKAMGLDYQTSKEDILDSRRTLTDPSCQR